MIRSCMRYGSPSIEIKLAELTEAGCNDIYCLPMFPQYSETTTGSIIEKLNQLKKLYVNPPNIKLIKNFSNNPTYITALVNHLTRYQIKGSEEHLILSFHGIPLSYVNRGDQYEEYCQQTADLIAQQLELDKDQYSLTFQSRFGPEEWLKPYTDIKIEELSKSNIKVAVFCPGFLVDCLETIDEMGYEAKKSYEEFQGPSFRFIPCLNDSPELIETLIALYLETDHYRKV